MKLNALANVPAAARHDPVIADALTGNRHQFLAYLTRRLGNRADAEDVLQDFCAKAIARQHQLRNADSMVAWLYSLLRTTLLDFHRKRSRRRHLDATYAAEALPEPQSHEEITQHLCACVRGLLPGLHSDQADLIARLDLADEPRDAVADDLKISSGTLAVRLHRARQALKDRVTTFCKSCLSDGFLDCSCPSPDLRRIMSGKGAGRKADERDHRMPKAGHEGRKPSRLIA